jgi:hypothetical protein
MARCELRCRRLGDGAAIAIYFNDATLAAAFAFVARWCAGYRVENTDGVFHIREDEPTPRISAGFHKTP